MVANKVKFTKKEVAQKLGVSVSSLYYKTKRERIDLELKGQSETVVGFNLSNRHNKELVLGALESALANNPKPKYLHSDQGSEYDSQAYTKFCETIGIKISMSNKSSPWENSYQESFSSHFKVQLADINRFYDIAELVEEIPKLIWYHNNERIHSVL